MLEISNLEVKYKNFSALKIKEKIKVNENDFVGVIGSNGAGKTTLIKAITNQVHYKGSIVKPNKISVHLQENNYPTVLTCKTIIEGLLKTTIKKDKKLKNLIDYFDFNDLLKRKVGQLSGGQKQKITLIMVLYQEAPLTCFDEMTTGLDFEARNKLMENIQAWYKEKKAALLLISHYYEELEKLANKLLIIDKGEIIDFDYIDKLFLKHVGYSAIVVEDENLEMFNDKKIQSKKGTQAFSIRNKQEETEIAQEPIKRDKKFSISRNSISLIYLNAIYNRRNSEEKKDDTLY